MPSSQLSSRRAVIAALAAVAIAPGCASRYPRHTLASVGAKRIAFVKPRYDPNLKLEVSAWGNTPSAATLAKERSQINAALSAWDDVVIASFSNALVSSLDERSIAVERISRGNSDTTPPDYYPYVHSYLTAGFVYKTFSSATFAPFVEVLLQLVTKDGPVYHRLYIASNRPYNVLMDNLPASTSYQLSDPSSLQANPSIALDALRALATQLGKQFASELLA